MSLSDDVNSLKNELRMVSKGIKDIEFRPVKKQEYKLPFGIKAKAKRNIKQGKILVIYMRSNRSMEFRFCKVVGGLIELDGETYKAYEGKAIYHYRKYPVMMFYEWRLTAAGGVTESYQSRVIGGELEEKVAKELKIGDFAQQTIIRAIEKIELDKEIGKKKGKLPIVWIIIGIGILLYFLAPMLGL